MAKLRRRIVSILLLLGLGGLGTLWLCDSVVEQSCEGVCFSRVEDVPKRQVGVLLGTSKYVATGQVNLYYWYRIEAAARLFQAGKVDYLLVSGDNRHYSYNEASTLRRDLIAKGIPAERIYRDYAGFRTLDSVLRAWQVFGQRDFVVISQPFQNARALYIAQAYGLNAVGFNAQDVNLPYGIKVQLRELLARVVAILDVHVWGAEPHFLGPMIEIGSTPPT